MSQDKIYKTAKAFRAALENRLRDIATKNNTEILRLRRQVAFDRLLARLFYKNSNMWALKGGYAMQLRISNSRSTKDVDLAMKESIFVQASSEERGLLLRDLVQECAGRSEKGPL